MSWGGAAHLLSDFSQAVYKIKGLAELIAANEDETIINRFRIIDLARSLVRAVVIDADEDFERKTTPMSGVPEVLDRFSTRMAAAAQMPVTLMMGQSPAGLNATGASDIRFFYDTIKAKQTKHLVPPLERVLTLIFKAKEGPTKGKEPEKWSIKPRPLWQLTEKEQAEVRKLQAETDEIYINSQVAAPEEIAISRFGGDKYSTETVIDFESRKEMADATQAIPGDPKETETMPGEERERGTAG
jgi:phage-related protein (TIGR01555 family)